MTSMASTNAETQEMQNANRDEQQHRRDRRGSLWSRFRSLSHRARTKALSADEKSEAGDTKDGDMMSAKSAAIENVVENDLNEKLTTPKLMDEPAEENVKDGDKKPAAKSTSDKEKIVPFVTMQEATYSKKRMIEALKMLGPFLAPEPATNETGHLDSVLERNFLVKDEESSKQIVKMMMSSQDLSVEFRLLIVAAFRNSCAHNQDLTKLLLLNCENTTMIGAKIMDRWMYEATKNLEYLATTVTDEKKWFHALTAPFLVMECLKVLWHCLMTEKKELLIDKRNQLNKLHGEFGLDWNQPDYLEDVKACGHTIGADAFVSLCDTIENRLNRIMGSRETIKIDNAARQLCSGFTRHAAAPRPRPIVRRDDRTPEEIAQAQHERAVRIERDRIARLARVRRMEELRTARAAEVEARDEAVERDDANANARNNERAARRRARRLREALAEMERNERAFVMAQQLGARLRRNGQGGENNQRRGESNARALAPRAAESPRNEETASNHEASGQVQSRGEEAPQVVAEQDDTWPTKGATNNVEVSHAQTSRSFTLNDLIMNEEDPRMVRALEDLAQHRQNRNNEGTNNAVRPDENTMRTGGGGTVANQNALLISRLGAARGSAMPANEENVSTGDQTTGGAVQGGSQPAEEATISVDGTNTRRINVQGPVLSVNGETQHEDAPAADEGSEQNNNGPRAVNIGLFDGIHPAFHPRRGNNNDGVVANGRDDDDFSAAVAGDAFSHIDGDRRGLFMRTLRNNEGRAAAMARRLEFEEEELLWGPRLPARRRLMMARRAIRDGQLDAFDVEQELFDLDMIAYMEEMEMYDPFGFDRLARPARPEPPRRAPALPVAPTVPRHLIELRELEDLAKTKPFSRIEGLELVKPSLDFDMQQCFIRRVTACVGWAIHGLIFEFADGKRQGTLMVNPGDRPMKLNDKNLSDRACVGWTDIEYGDYIVGMHGDSLGNNVQSWFCYSLVLTFASGKTLRYEANHEAWRGSPFSFDVPMTTPCFVTRISFKHDQNEDMLGMVTSIHLPMSQKTFAHLPLEQKKAVEDVLEIGKQIDCKLENSGRKPMGDDVWWLILSFLRAWELLPPSPNVKGTKDGQRLFDLFAKRFEYSLPSA